MRLRAGQTFALPDDAFCERAGLNDDCGKVSAIRTGIALVAKSLFHA